MAHVSLIQSDAWEIQGSRGRAPLPPDSSGSCPCFTWFEDRTEEAAPGE